MASVCSSARGAYAKPAGVAATANRLAAVPTPSGAGPRRVPTALTGSGAVQGDSVAGMVDAGWRVVKGRLRARGGEGAGHTGVVDSESRRPRGAEGGLARLTRSLRGRVSPGRPGRNNFLVHLVCRDMGFTHMESLCNLDKLVGKGRFRFIGFPLRIKGRSGSPIRAVAVLDE